ncbi:ABC transporter ATP-binding protein [Salipaludibacillus daqingensis]|uniref:ABC transporter ATP-binding protein n=1 Tax=Salipaludibacillus daqingensis TaxID=3041001 RepID=UPI0024735E91|nr:oligopeptide/dipeptide ABC transporter ATP-binding protein [Salipaludibacillus daqingensis]
MNVVHGTDHTQTPPSSEEVLIQVEHLQKYFPLKKKKIFGPPEVVKAVDDISFKIYKGETLGLVGESGCGKSTLGRNLLRLQEPTGGKVFLRDVNFTDLSKKELRSYRKHVQMIYQDPFGSLNPRFTVGQVIGEMLTIHKLATGDARTKKIKELLALVGLDPDRIDNYPHEFSGGQRQRIGIARSLALDPEFIVADEPVSALDVSVQSQIINLLIRLKKELGLTLLFIAHGLNVVRHISDRVGVMYLGKLVELSGTDDLFDHPAHPYTAVLLSTVPDADPAARRERIVLKGEVPSPINPPSGCRFRTRCPLATEKCAELLPELEEIRPGHHVACHYPLEEGESLKERISKNDKGAVNL